MALPYESASQSYLDTLEDINLVFTFIFIAEMLFKLVSFGFKGYWVNNWNKFDFCVVISSIVDLIMNQLGNQLGSFLRVGPQLARILRVLRVSRLFRLAKGL